MVASNWRYSLPCFHFKINFKMSIQQKYELFNEYLDSIYEKGYAERLATENPASYSFQFEQFKNMYV